MNLRVVLFSGIITTLVGMMVGLAIAHISQNQERRIINIVGGGVVGFVLGAGYSMIMQQRQTSEDNSDSDRLK